MKAHYLIVMGFRHLEPIVKISRRRPTLLPAHSQVLVAVSSIALPHDRSFLTVGLHSLCRHFYESSLLNCNVLSSFIPVSEIYPRRRPTLLPAHSLVLVAVSWIALPHDRSFLTVGLHSLSRHFYESSLL